MPSDPTTPIPEKLVRKFGGPVTSRTDAQRDSFSLAEASKSSASRFARNERQQRPIPSIPCLKGITWAIGFEHYPHSHAGHYRLQRPCSPSCFPVCSPGAVRPVSGLTREAGARPPTPQFRASQFCYGGRIQTPGFFAEAFWRQLGPTRCGKAPLIHTSSDLGFATTHKLHRPPTRG
jgi:hypothetical protein